MRKPRFALGSQKTFEVFTLQGRKDANKYVPADPEAVRKASQERADKVRAPVSSYIHERNMAKYLVIKHGREEAMRILSARSEMFGR